MTTVTFNTHTYIKRLMKQGMPEKLAEEVANGMAENKDTDLRNVATKVDLEKVKTELEKVRTEVYQLGNKLLIWFIATAFVILGAMISGFAMLISMLQVADKL